MKSFPIEKLATLVVGEIVPSYSPHDSAFALNAVPAFDPFEYRRSALTEKSIVTSGTDGAYPVLRLRFCSLYPFDARNGQPRMFLPGQSVEILARIGSQSVSRYYTPVCGDLSAFEIHVKVYPEGRMSQFLRKQGPGQRQFKVRGPFGVPVIDPESPLTLAAHLPEDIVFITGGTGIAPFLQLLQYIMLPVLQPLTVLTPYEQTMSDELTLSRGDRVVTQDHYLDGWALGHNLTTGATGVFPLSVTSPLNGPRSRLTLLNAVHTPQDLIGLDLLEAAMLAHPDALEVHHFCDRGSGSIARDGVVGTVHAGKMDNTAVADVLADWAARILGGPLWNALAVVCGPRGFDGFAVDAVTELGVDGRVVRVLPADRVMDRM
ncbi:hypothetical protein BDK51DRAFT_27093 [Blyttiomyces helicus]|uniref:FAD-binding FR-type domain-containing protein n=1 Tax=Blyttiomyces helicus TaxID=388810 RepID=A0A4P9W2E2_9FUNG|nr:hypothetical protein BDK51DRAFT_27093 [Blyttiomyces helicus]|eukprot:RKO84948.1 hypothetical protein BDK51DRAFT_27093 [Blyttiomyces helicus]